MTGYCEGRKMIAELYNAWHKERNKVSRFVHFFIEYKKCTD